ncbi:hypothetical protein OBO34_15570 [Clostridiales Family XIII bacterium ASD5510]|uniref:Uncharacterized protein n=1 Tax=Hominibacterium faecale TaxID=2839743 RepID=A0A9J6QV52_9FIRM|nr:hypothetical protein [Hominibacterium faecale]MCC2865873.1 hypothetical protein [Anaerovorax odorimutans]MCU7379764.1 hypothetical protein [Hominibacterium faecale]
MDKKTRTIIIAVSAAAAVAMILGIVVIAVQVKEVRDLIGEGSVVVHQTQSYDDASIVETPEPPSIFCDTSVKFKGKDTISVEAGTVECQLSVTPVEFREGTKAKVKIDGKTYALKQKENTFVGTFPVSLFKSVDPEVYLIDEKATRTESVDGENPYISTDFGWSAAGSDPSAGKGETRFDLQVTFEYGEFIVEAPSNAQVVVMAGGKQIYEKQVKVMELGEDFPGFDWKDSVKNPDDAVLDVYVVTKDDKGLTYRYMLGQAGKKQDFFDEAKKSITVLSPDGKVLVDRKIKE